MDTGQTVKAGSPLIKLDMDVVVINDQVVHLIFPEDSASLAQAMQDGLESAGV